MNENNCKLNTTPNKADYEEVMDWLKKEREEYEEGFYCNRRVIKKCFEEKEFITFQISGNNIGFALWRTFNDIGFIEVFEIHAEFRKKGVGKYFGNKCLDFLESKNCRYVELECVPEKSQYFWRKLGFKDKKTQFENKVILEKLLILKGNI